MINIGMLCPNPGDGTSYYRAWGPLNELRKSMPELNLMSKDGWEWPDMGNIDIGFIQRPFQVNHAQACMFAKKNGVKVWADFDDNLLDIPRSNPVYDQYKGKQEHIISSLDFADVVTVSTEELAKVYGKYNHNVKVVENGINTKDWGSPDLEWEGRQNVILWRGSPTHQGDLYHAKEAILDAYRSLPGWKWVFLGYEPWFITEEMNENDYAYEPFKNLHDFVYDLKSIRPRVTIFPLDDNELNRGKSLNCVEDATWIGSLFVCPKWHSSAPNFFEEIKEAALASLDKGFTETALKDSMGGVRTLKKQNEKRRELILSLIGRKASMVPLIQR
jgi:glycosyltransferase involved in cell wall biosynthesis